MELEAKYIGFSKALGPNVTYLMPCYNGAQRPKGQQKRNMSKNAEQQRRFSLIFNDSDKVLGAAKARKFIFLASN